MEEWRDIPGYEGRYQASSEGRVRSLDRVERFPEYVTASGQRRAASERRFKGRVLRPAAHATGHLMVVLGRGENIDVHVAVMRAFEGEPPAGHEVLHRNHTPADNRRSNLFYGTRSENLRMDYAAGKRRVRRRRGSVD